MFTAASSFESTTPPRVRIDGFRGTLEGGLASEKREIRRCMKLDVIVPTYNRSGLLTATLQSLLRATVPMGLQITVYVIDNNSKDDTAEVVRVIQTNASLPIKYHLETRQGLSQARNAGIRIGGGDLVGFIDDDEEITESWYEVIAREFQNTATSYIGGPYLPSWVSPVPDWLPPGYHAAIGAIPPKPRALFNSKFPGILMGGNAVLRRAVFDLVGTYSPHLGRSGKGLLSEEDAEFYRRLLKAEVRGVYVPELVILHHVAPERLTRKYHRRWAYWRAVSQGLLDRSCGEQVSYLFGVPRHRIGRAIRSILAMPGHRLRAGGKGQAFADELALWDLAGFVNGKHFIRINNFYEDESSPSSGRS